MKFFTSLFERAFKMMNNGVYFIMIALLVAKFFNMTCDVIIIVDTKWCKITKNGIYRLFLYRTDTLYFVALPTKFHDISTVTFPWQHNGLQVLSNHKMKSGFSPSRSVICSCCLFSGCELMWTLHSTSTRKSVRLWSNK